MALTNLGNHGDYKDWCARAMLKTQEHTGEKAEGFYCPPQKKQMENLKKKSVMAALKESLTFCGYKIDMRGDKAQGLM